MKQVYVKTFGCQMNVHDSERMLGLLKREGYAQVNDPKKADLIIFNTCSIRQKAEQKFYSMLGRLRSLKKRNSTLKIAVAGCIAQQEGEGMKQRVPYVDCIIGPQNVGRIAEAVSNGENIFIDDNPDIAVTELPAERENRIRAWVNIMYGCNNFCSYCVVPYTRGREISRPLENIIAEVNELASMGYKEVTLLGQNVNSYSGDCTFPQLLKHINKIDGIERIRFVTSHPKDFENEAMSAVKELDRVCEHIHLPLQSGSSRILHLMNRGYSFDEYLKKVEILRYTIPNVAITTDIIAGFPGETREDHKETVSALQKIEFDGIFAFKYSPRPMTKAAGMADMVGEETKSERLSEILAIQDEISLRKNKSLEGKIQEVLIDREEEKNIFSGRTRTNKIVTVVSDNHIEPGDIVKVIIDDAYRHSLKSKSIV